MPAAGLEPTQSQRSLDLQSNALPTQPYHIFYKKLKLFQGKGNRTLASRFQTERTTTIRCPTPE